MKNQFSPQLISWAENVIETSTPIAEDFNLEYYPLQSKVKLNPDILFIGLNPGGGYGYDSQINNPNWEFDKTKKKLTAERLLKGNPTFDEEFHAGKWKYGNGLKKIDFFKDSVDKYDFVFMNYVYYSSKKFSELNKTEFKQAIQDNISHTFDLINLINPKHIIVLGTGTGIDKISKNNKLLIQGYRKRLLVQGEINGRIVYGIPHPSYNNFQEENNAISETLKKLFNGETVEPFSVSSSEIKSLKSKKVTSKFDSDSFLKFFSKYKPEVKEKWIDVTVKGLGNDEILIRINHKDNVLGIRNTDKKSYKELFGGKFYNQFFDDSFERDQPSWFITKKFQKFNDVNTDIIDVLNKFLLGIESERK